MLANFQNIRILVIGDVMIDQYLIGEVERISPEAPVPIVNLQKEENRLGGAANVALNIHSLGGKVHLCSVLGTGKDKNLFCSLLETNGLSTDGLIESEERSTTIKTRILARNQQLLRYDRETPHYLSHQEELVFLAKIKSVLDENELNLILFQDYNKGVLSKKIIREVIDIATHRNIPIVVDPKSENFFEYKNVTLFKPNLREIQHSLSIKINPQNIDSLRNAATILSERLNNYYTLITLGEHGMFWQDKYQNFGIVPAHIRNIADVCGAGDTVISVVALGLGAEKTIHEVVTLANLAGGIVCEKVGVVPIQKQELEQEYLLMNQKIS